MRLVEEDVVAVDQRKYVLNCVNNDVNEQILTKMTITHMSRIRDGTRRMINAKSFILIMKKIALDLNVID